jgi:DNA helicase-2/ATP-dependent DNA helicase PcrA
MELLKNLNEAQRAAVVNYDCPSLIVAGAGSGKTRVLTSRIAWMLQQGVPPWKILALTFTNKAAAEMRERIGKMVSTEQSARLWMGTFHSIFLKILRMEADKLGYPSSFTIYDTADSRNLLKHIIKDMNLNDEVYKPAGIQSRISLAKNNLVTPASYEANATLVGEDRQRRQPAFADIYKEYARRCRQNAAMDFDDMLLNINILFKDHPDVLAKYQERFEYILVDEYQDTNYAQYIIIRRLAERHSRVCVVGDDSQSIYSFRGAKIENILRFRNDFPAAQTFKLEQNYRSTRTIVGAANSVIEKNANRLPKESFSAGETGERIKVLKAYTDQEEASLVADELRARVRGGGAQWSDAAILYRTNAQSRAFEEAFRRRGIPYRIYGGMSFYQRKEIKDLLAYMHLIVNPRDDEAFRRVVNYPARGIGDVTVGRLAETATARGVSLWEAAAGGDAAGLNGGALKHVGAFTELIAALSMSRGELSLYDFGLEVATRSGIIGLYKTENTPEAQSALDNIEELLNSMRTFEGDAAEMDAETGEAVVPSLVDWLQSVTLLTDQDQEGDEDRNRVTLMTIHAAKGLEYRYVFIVGMEENLFPSQMSMDGAEGIEEERRLFYVALTRACEAAVLSFAETRFKWGTMEFCRPSRFLGEIDPAYLDVAFDLDDTAPAKQVVKKNYDAHNARGRQYGGGGGAKPAAGSPAPARQAPPVPTVRPASPPPNLKPVAATTRATVADSGQYAVGQRVAHAKFGIGTVAAVEQAGGDHKVTVAFDGDAVPTRTLLTKFAKLAIVG